jgi:hypothetical protein
LDAEFILLDTPFDTEVIGCVIADDIGVVIGDNIDDETLVISVIGFATDVIELVIELMIFIIYNIKIN